MTTTAILPRVLFLGAALLQSAAADAEVTYRSRLLSGGSWSGMTGQVVETTTPGAYDRSGAGYTMATSGSPTHDGTAEASFTVGVDAFDVSTNLSYVIDLTGPDDVLVPVRIKADGHSRIFGIHDDGATAGFQMFSGVQNPLVNLHATVNGPEGPDPALVEATLAFDQTVYVMSNTDVTVSLTAGGWSYGTYFSRSKYGDAFIDPEFTIDPAYASEYAFVGLPEPTAAVSEPANAALLALGALALAIVFASRMRRALSSPATPILSTLLIRQGLRGGSARSR